MKTLTLALALSLSAVGMAALPTTAQAADDLVYTGLFSNTAVGGYDTVSYHTGGAPVRGSREFSTQWNGANWHFASQENLDLFLANPEAYAPAYGGYCAWAMAEGYTAKGSPNHWRIVDDVLYLNYDQTIQDRWEADIPGFIEAANANYPTILED